MKLNNRKKISSLFDKTIDNKNKLEEKKIKYNPQKSYLTKYTYPSIIYESDWQNIFFTDNGNLSDYFYLTKFDSTALYGQQVPVRLTFNTSIILDIPESWLPHIQVSFLTMPYPDVEPIGLSEYNKWLYSSTNYYEIYGDSTLIYKGTSPTSVFFPDSDRISGNLSSSLISKWYYGNLEYSLSGHDYRLLGYISAIDTYYDFVPLSGHPGYYSYKRFITLSTDSLSASSVTGTGTYIVVTAYEDGSGNPQTSTVSTKNVSMSAPIFEDQTDFTLIGYLYKDGLLQGYYNPLYVSFTGTLGGTATLSGFSFDWTTRKTWKVFYSNKKAKQFQFSTSTFYIVDPPSITDYQTGTLPYSKITVEVNNTEDYPQIYQNTPSTVNPSGNFVGWAKMAENKFKLYLYGLLNFSTPATVEGTPYEADFVDEDWNSDGTTYVRTANDRGKETPLYLPNPNIMLKLKYIVSLDNNFEYRELKDYE